MSETNIANLYAHGQIIVAPDVLRQLGVDGALADFLSTQGLPNLPTEPMLLGLRFEQPFGYKAADGSDVAVIANERWAKGLYIGIEPKHKHVLAVSDGQQGALFINSSLHQFLDFLATAQNFFSRASKQADQPTTMTIEQARERLAALRRGEIQPKSPPTSPFDRAKEIKRARQLFREIDAPALVGRTWWNRILEQLDDGLI
jgi:hypothetical protein